MMTGAETHRNRAYPIASQLSRLDLGPIMGKSPHDVDTDDEAARLAAVHALGLLDTQPDERFDRITRLAASQCETSMALIALIDAERVWPLSSIGMPRASIPRHHTLCALASAPDEIMALGDASQHPATSASPLVNAPGGIRFYATVPLFSPDGYRIGSLSVCDDRTRPGLLTETQARALRDLAAMCTEALWQSLAIERLSAERSASFSHVQAVISATPLPLLVIAPDGTVRGWNPAAEHVFGWSAEEVIGYFGPHCAPEHVEEGRMVTARILAGEQLLGFETTRIRKDGSYLPVAISSAPLLDWHGRISGAVVVLEDISARRQAEAAREREAERARRHAQAVQAIAGDPAIEMGDIQAALGVITRAATTAMGLPHIIIWMLDEDGTTLHRVAEARTDRAPPVPEPDPLSIVKLASDDITARFGRQRGFSVEDVGNDPEHAPYLHQHIDTLGAGAVIFAPIFIGKTLRGSVAGLHYGGPCHWEQDELAFMASLADIIALNIETGRRVEALERLALEKERAEAANRTKSLFLANMGHELRTPLNAIIGFADLLHGPNLADEQRAEFARHVMQAGQHLLAVFNDILDQAKVEAGTLLLDTRPMSLEPLIRDAIGLVLIQAEEQQVHLRQAVEGKLPVLQADPVKLRQALVNLLANAVKFSPAGGEVLLQASATPEGDVMIQVIDQGPGVALAEVQRAFEPFAQLDEGLARRAGGAGLGLPLSKAYVELHGGRLSLEPAPSGGTAAIITLPASLTIAM